MSNIKSTAVSTEEGGAEFVVACSNAAELLELIEEAFDVVDLSGPVGFAQLDAHSSTEINYAPIKTGEIAATNSTTTSR